jgi:hypothetical protein
VSLTGWPKTLSENDFVSKKTAPPSTNVRQGYELLAETDASFSSTGTTTAQVDDGTWKVSKAVITVTFSRIGSWMLESVKKDPKQKPLTLAHEQGHFDMLGLVAREFERKLAALTGDTDADLQTNYQALETAMSTKIDTLNDTYDAQVSRNGTAAQQAVRQKAWLTAIALCKATSTSDFTAPP